MECTNKTSIESEGDKDDKIKIKEEYCDQDEITDPIKAEHFNQEIISTESHFVECDYYSDVDAKIGTNQETWEPNDMKSNFENSSTDASIETIKSEIDIKEEPLWFDSPSSVSHNKEKENIEKNQTFQDILPVESPRLPSTSNYSYDSTFAFGDTEKGITSHKIVCGKNASQHTSKKKIKSSPNSNSTSEQNDESAQAQNYEIDDNHYTRKCASTTPYKCDICGKYYSCRSSLNKHFLIHSERILYKCEICNKNFTQISHLKDHIRLHSGTKAFQCHICDKRFARNSNLTKHTLVHSGTKPYSCDICEKSFADSSTLKKHTVIHSGAKPYKCDICEEPFSYMSTLRRHKFAHLGIRPYKCEMCQKSFVDGRSLKRHAMIHSRTK